MTRIDFYVLQESTTDGRLNFVCRLVEKAIGQGNKVMIATEHAAQSQEIDERLWNFKPESFIPHQQIGGLAAATPVTISHRGDDPQHHDVLVNLRATVPPEFSRFQRLVEIVVQDSAILESTRKNFAFYKARGYQLNTHKL